MSNSDSLVTFPLDKLPDDVIGVLFENLPPGAPERLRLAAKLFNKVYKKIEGQLAVIPVEKCKLSISGYFENDNYLTFIQLESEADPREFYLEHEQPSFQRLLHFLRIAKVLIFRNLTDWPELFENPHRSAILRDVLAKQSYDKIIVYNSASTIARILDLFRKGQKVRWFADQESLESIDIPTLERVPVVEVKMKIPAELMKKVAKYLSPRSLRVQNNEYLSFMQYFEDWEED